MTTPERVRASVLVLALQNDDASEGSRTVLAALLDSIGLEILDENLRWYCFGLADGLRKPSRSRRRRRQEMN